jgi:hypothetical protein
MKRTRVLILYAFLFLLPVSAALADNTALFKAYEDSLRQLGPRVFKSKTDEAKKAANQRYQRLLEECLKLDGSFDYPFDSLRDIGKMRAPDASFRIYNWNLPKNDGTMEYFAYIQHRNPKTQKMDLFPLTDKSTEIKNPESQSLDAKKWFGCLYYKIIRTKSGKNTYYTLLGLDEHNNLTWKKLIEVLWFDKEGAPHFGESIFMMGGKVARKRVVFEFHSEMIMALKYNEEKGMIIFDNLAPESPEGKGVYETYVMDGSYNGLIFKKGRWNFIPDVNALNPKTPNDKFYEDPRAEPGKKDSQQMGPPKKGKAGG